MKQNARNKIVLLKLRLGNTFWGGPLFFVPIYLVQFWGDIVSAVPLRGNKLRKLLQRILCERLFIAYTRFYQVDERNSLVV